MKHEMFWLLLLSLGGLYIFPNVILFIMFSPAMSINSPSQIVESLYRSLRNVWVYRLFRYTRGGPCQHGFMCGCKQWCNDINESNWNMHPITIIQFAVRVGAYVHSKN